VRQHGTQLTTYSRFHMVTKLLNIMQILAYCAADDVSSGSNLMKNVGISVAALALLATSGTAMAAGESGRVISQTQTVTSLPSLPALPPLQGGGLVGVQSLPEAYQPLARGATLPSFWMQPQYFIDDYARYGFAAPQDGEGWSRYYDDAVLTDGTGRVVDVVKGVDWKKFDNAQLASGAGTTFNEGELDRRRPDTRDFYRERDRKRGGVGRAIGSIGGALIGGAVGAVAGNLIAGKGERLAGSLIGGGVGALAGLAIGEATRGGKGRHHGGHRGPHWGHGGRHYPGGYYYETFQTVNYTPVAPITTTTTSTKVYYETITTGKSTYYPKRPHKHRPHRCACHR
jgi:Ni/Co efflux regulator RcnB